MLSRGSIDLTAPFLGQQLSAGVWGGYRRSAGLMGLIKPADSTRWNVAGRGTSPAHVRCTVRGEHLARQWREQNLEPGATAHQVAAVAAAGHTDLDRLWQLFKPDKAPYSGILKPMNSAVHSSTLANGLAGLRRVWDETGSVQPDALQRKEALLDDSQTGLPQQAAAIIQLFNLVEKPYRDYLVTGDTPAPSRSDWNEPCWTVARQASPEVAELRTAGMTTPGSWDGVQRWAADLARRRGHNATPPGQAPTGYGKAAPPAMSLRAAAALFAQGLLGEALPQTEVRTAVTTAQTAASRGGL